MTYPTPTYPTPTQQVRIECGAYGPRTTVDLAYAILTQCPLIETTGQALASVTGMVDRGFLVVEGIDEAGTWLDLHNAQPSPSDAVPDIDAELEQADLDLERRAAWDVMREV